jgi:hypothetical protein
VFSEDCPEDGHIPASLINDLRLFAKMCNKVKMHEDLDKVGTLLSEQWCVWTFYSFLHNKPGSWQQTVSEICGECIASIYDWKDKYCYTPPLITLDEVQPKEHIRKTPLQPLENILYYVALRLFEKRFMSVSFNELCAAFRGKLTVTLLLIIKDFALGVEKTGQYVGRAVEKTALATVVLQHAYQALSNTPDTDAVINTWNDDSLYVLRKILSTKVKLFPLQVLKLFRMLPIHQWSWLTFTFCTKFNQAILCLIYYNQEIYLTD